MKKLILLSLLSFGIYSCDSDIGTPTPDCVVDGSITVWLEDSFLYFPSYLPSDYQSTINPYSANLNDAYRDGNVNYGMPNRAYALINYSESLFCVGETSKLYPEDPHEYGATTFHGFPSFIDGGFGECTGTLKSDIWYHPSNNGVYAYVLWTGSPGTDSYDIDFGIGNTIETYNNSNGRNSSYLIINDSKNYIYSGGARTTI